MKKIFILSFVFLTVISCSTEDNLLVPAELDHPSAMRVFCQASPENSVSAVNYEYDDEGNLITEISIHNGEVSGETTFVYDSENQLMSEVYLTDLRKTEKTYVYNEDNLLVNILYKFTDYDTAGQLTNESESEAPREYVSDQLVKEWAYWGGFTTYEYKDGRIVTRIEHTLQGEAHHFTYYKYSRGLLAEEKKETSVGGLMYLKTFTYDSQNRLIQIQDRENIIEENEYEGKKLIEKRVFYFGIDPCYSACCGNFIYRYEY